MNLRSPVFMIGFIFFCSIINMSFDLRLSSLLLLPLFLLSVLSYPRIFTLILLMCGLFEDVFFGRLLGMTPLLLLLFQVVYQVGFQVLFKLENFYLLWGGFFLSSLMFQCALYIQYLFVYEHFQPSIRAFFVMLLSFAVFPFLLKNIVHKDAVRYGS